MNVCQYASLFAPVSLSLMLTQTDEPAPPLQANMRKRGDVMILAVRQRDGAAKGAGKEVGMPMQDTGTRIVQGGREGEAFDAPWIPKSLCIASTPVRALS